MPSSDVDHTGLFARVHIHGLARSPTGEPRAVTLERHISFPMPVEVSSMSKTAPVDIQDISPRALSPVFELEARVCADTLNGLAEEQSSHEPKGILGQGRAGLVFPLEILAIRREHLNDGVGGTELDAVLDFLSDPHRLCVKVATPGYARALAREAWSYEQLDANGLTGVVSPRCYGVFQAPLTGRKESSAGSDAEAILDIPGYDYYAHAQKPIYRNSELHTARMIEERYDIKTNTLSLDPRFADDRAGNYASSAWVNFRETPQTTNLTVLIMDRLGERLTAESFDASWSVESSLPSYYVFTPTLRIRESDIRFIYDHLVPVKIIHGDGRFANILRVPPHLQVPCPLHQQSHEWNLVDWENASMLCDIKANNYIAKTQTVDIILYYSSHGGEHKYEIRT